MRKLEIGVIVISSLTSVLMASACSSSGDATAPAEESSATMALTEEPSAPAALTETDRSLGIGSVLDGGWLVDVIVPGSPAELAGILPGDRLIAIGEFSTEDMSKETFRRYQALISSGVVDLAIEREGQSLTFRVETAPSQDVFPELFDSSIVAMAFTCFEVCLDRCLEQVPFGQTCGTCFTCTKL
jgi:S1-C subfamily serine protease